MLRRTSLYDWHHSHSARLVEFGGWEMPIQYTTINDEHAVIRNEVGLFDVSHMGRLSFAGNDVTDFLQYVCTNNVAGMKDFQIRYNLICNENGGIRDDVLVYRWPYGWSMVVNASNREKIVEHLEQNIGSRDVKIDDQTINTTMIAVQGPKAIELCEGLVEAETASLKYYTGAPTRYQKQPCVVSRTGYTGEDGLEFMLGNEHGPNLWEDLIQRGAKACGLGARDTLRLEAAMPLYGHELSEELDPLQAGLQWAVKLDKGDFLGRDALLQRQADTSRNLRVGLELQGKRIAREGAVIKKNGQDVGLVTSGTFSPTLQKSIAMGYVNPACSAEGTALSIDIRGKEESATVVPLPFYDRKKK